MKKKLIIVLSGLFIANSMDAWRLRFINNSRYKETVSPFLQPLVKCDIINVRSHKIKAGTNYAEDRLPFCLLGNEILLGVEREGASPIWKKVRVHAAIRQIDVIYTQNDKDEDIVEIKEFRECPGRQVWDPLESTCVNACKPLKEGLPRNPIIDPTIWRRAGDIAGAYCCFTDGICEDACSRYCHGLEGGAKCDCPLPRK